MRRLQCAEVWGGIKNEEVHVCSPGMTVSLYSGAADGGKGGDVYYFSVCHGDCITRLALADVVGHGEQVSRISRSIYEEMAARIDEPDLPAMVRELNERIIADDGPVLTTGLFTSYRVDLRTLWFCDAGHYPILVGRDGVWQPLETGSRGRRDNLPLGVSRDVHYDASEVRLNVGDRLLLYTDGVIEAPGPEREQFGLDRLRATLDEIDDREPMRMVARLLERLRGWTGGSLEHDDVTLIAIRID